MIEFLVDTDWAADYLKGKEDAVQLLSSLIRERWLGMSIIFYGELSGGRAGLATRRGVQIGVGGHQSRQHAAKAYRTETGRT